jgi:hypothetical protein
LVVDVCGVQHFLLTEEDHRFTSVVIMDPMVAKATLVAEVFLALLEGSWMLGLCKT